jgi:hypothetical protein
MTVFALFGDDIRIALFKKSADDYFNVITIVCLAGFSVEIFMQSLAIENYFGSLYFWLDLVSTVSMILDVSWIWDSLTGNHNFDLEDGAVTQANFLRASRASRIGARMSRLSRVMRLVRLLRVVRLYKKANS